MYRICIKRTTGACTATISAQHGEFGLQKLNSKSVTYDRLVEFLIESFILDQLETSRFSGITDV